MVKCILSLFAAVLLVTSVAIAAGPKDYQVTGPVLDVTDDVITVEKAKDDRWEIGRDKNTKVSGELKKGSRVTVHYKMTATSVEVKDAGKAKTKGDEKAKAESKAKPEEKKAETKTK